MAFRYDPSNMGMWNTTPQSKRAKPHQVMVPDAQMRKDTTTSMWDLGCFKDGVVEWMNTQTKGDCYYSTYEDWSATARTRYFVFYFVRKEDAALFKMFWV